MSVRAFELVPLLDGPVVDKASKIEVTAVDFGNERLYVGTSDGQLFHYTITKAVSKIGRQVFRNRLESKKPLGLGKKPVEKIHFVPQSKKVIVVCGGTMVVLGMDTLAVDIPDKAGGTTKHISCLAADETSGRTHICVARKKSVLFQIVHKDRLVTEHDINIGEVPVAMARHALTVCIATARRYLLVSAHQGGKITDLFPFESIKPVVEVVGLNEFLVLLNTTDTFVLGQFITTMGLTNRAPVSFPDKPDAVAESFPYLLAVQSDAIEVRSLIDQQPKQNIPFRGGRAMQRCEGQLFIASQKHVYLLLMTSIEEQINELLRDLRTEEALLLAEQALDSGGSDEDGRRKRLIMGRIQLRTGFSYLAEGRSYQATEMFAKGGLDPRELCAVVPELLPADTDFRRDEPCMHGRLETRIPDSVYPYMAEYLQKKRSEGLPENMIVDVDTALAKLFALNKIPDSAQNLVEYVSVRNRCNVKDAVPFLASHGHHHAVALLYLRDEQYEEALETWTRLFDREIDDAQFPGLPVIVEALRNVQDKRLLFHFAAWVVRHDAVEGVSVFTRHSTRVSLQERVSASSRRHTVAVRSDTRSRDRRRREGTQDDEARDEEEEADQSGAANEGGSVSDVALKMASSNRIMDILTLAAAVRAKTAATLFTADDVLEFLKPFGSVPTHLFLEHLVLGGGGGHAKHHTRLASVYLDAILGKEGDVESTRTNLRLLLETSALVDVEQILTRVEKSDLLREKAILYGKTGDHSRALDILVRQVGDFDAATRYCRVTRVDEPHERRRLYVALLETYLVPPTPEQTQLLEPAVKLLDEHGCDMDAAMVLELLPGDWGIAMMANFLDKAIRRNVHAYREKALVMNLMRAEYLQTRRDLVECHQQSVTVTFEDRCPVCERRFTDEAVIARYPNGTTLHDECVYDPLVCPVTHTRFSDDYNFD